MRRPPGNGQAASEGPGGWGLWGVQESRRLCCADHDRCQQALLQIGINMMALPGGRHLDSITLPGQRLEQRTSAWRQERMQRNSEEKGPFPLLHLMQVDSVQRWMEDLKLMTECECMCVLQAKPISLEEDAQGDLILAGGPSPGDPLQLLLKRGWVISTELRRIGQKLAQDRWARVHSMSVRLTCHARSMVSEYSTVSRSSSQEMGQRPFSPSNKGGKKDGRTFTEFLLCAGHSAGFFKYVSHLNCTTCKIEKLLMEKCSELSAVTERCLQVENEHVLKSMKACVSETLSTLGQHFGQLLELALTREVQALVRKIDASDNIYTTESTTGNLFSLTQEGAPLCRIIAKEGGVVALFKVCRQDSFRCLYPQALRTLASICCVEEGVHQLEKVDGVLCLANILTDDSHSEATRAEAAAVVAQVTSPHLPVTQHLSSFLESMEEIVTALVKLCQEASSGEVFLLASAALANITFFDTMACEMLLQLNAIRVLLEACSDKQRVDTPYTRDQIVTILANMSVLEQCASDIIQENGVQLIMGMLSEKPRSGTPAEVAACERVQQKAAVTLARLSRDPDVAREAVRLSCMSRLIELCRSPSERNSSDAVLVACLAALRRLAGVCPEGLQDSDFQQLVQPRLVDSFLLCSNMEESFV
ncbi:protein inscuteable homolog isoform X1 [Aotus nancymaae]|uniref:protein inscuteable homolog isoform X1 n=1 Tax=Aotus nancymaae TaxID=37293 RepID=UPI0030FE8A0C